MEESRIELMYFAEKNPRFVTEAIIEATNGEDLSEFSTEKVIMEYLSDDIIEKLLKRFRIINSVKK